MVACEELEALAADDDDAVTGCCERRKVPVAVALHDVEAVVVQEGVQFLREREPHGNAADARLELAVLVPAVVAGPLQDLRYVVVCLSQRAADIPARDVRVGLIVSLFFTSLQEGEDALALGALGRYGSGPGAMPLQRGLRVSKASRPPGAR